MTDSLDDLSLKDELKALAARVKPIEKDWFDTAPPEYPTKETTDQLQETLEELEHRGTVKVSSPSLYSPMRGDADSLSLSIDYSRARLLAQLPPRQDQGPRSFTPRSVFVLWALLTRFAPSQIFVGDKEGNVGLWDATKAQAAYEDEGVEENKGRFWHWRAHQRSVSSLKFAPNDLHTVRRPAGHLLASFR